MSSFSDTSVVISNFVRIILPDYVIRVHDGLGTVAFDDTDTATLEDFSGLGTLGTIGSVVSDNEISSKTLVLSLSGVDNALLTDISDAPNDWKDAAVDIWLGLFNEDGVLESEPVNRFRGVVSNLDITLGAETSSINVTCSSNLFDWNRTNKNKFTNASHQAIYPGDRFFEFVGVVDRNVVQFQSTQFGADTVRGI